MEDSPSDNDNRTVTLTSKSGDKFELSYKAAKQSNLVSDSIEKFDSSEEESPIIPIPKVETACLAKVVEFLKQFEKEPLEEITTPLPDNTFEGIVRQEWYRNFVQLDNPMLFDLVTAGNYMDIKPLLDLTCLQVSCQLMGKSTAEIRKILNIPEMTAEEERQARADHPWIFDD